MPGRFHEESGIWINAGSPCAGKPKPALFLDRDGVIVEERHYLSRAADVALIEGAGTTIAEANRRGIPVVVVSNQAGIGRGYYNWEAFEAVEEAIAQQLAQLNARVGAVFACGFYPEHPARKPNPGMLLAAAKTLNLDLAHSWIVGDHATDIEAGHNAGLRGGLHVMTGHGAGQREAVGRLSWEGFDVRLGDSIAEAALILDSL